MQLSAEQKEKLCKLERELERKRAHDEKNKEKNARYSESTGIPVNLVDMDVIKLGAMFGFIKPKVKLENEIGAENQGSVFDVFFGSDESSGKYDYSLVPSYYSKCDESITEAEKMALQQTAVKSQCEKFCSFVADVISEEINNVTKHMAICFDSLNLTSFCDVCRENMEVVLDSLKDENDEELWHQLSALRNALFGPMSVCDYRKALASQVVELRKAKKTSDEIYANMTWLDACLVAHPNFNLKTPTENDLRRLKRELRVRRYVKNPELKPFDIDRIAEQCCVPTLGFLKADEVVSESLLGPYGNNEIVYCASSYYVLNEIVGNGIRLWVRDDDLFYTTSAVRDCCVTYLVNSFRTLYAARYGTNAYLANFEPVGIFKRILSNCEYLSSAKFDARLRDIVRRDSTATPTELDYFNTFRSNSRPRNSESPDYFDKLFDGKVPANFKTKRF